MADNSTLPVSGGGTEVFANDDISSVKYPRVKPQLGADGSASDALGGAGTVSAGVQRMTLASDDPAVSALGAVADAAATQGATGSISAKLRTVTSQLNTLAGHLDGVEGLLGGTLTVGSHAVTNTALTNFGAGEYETVAASQTAQVLGATGAAGDYISGILVVPATTSPGNVLLLDNATSITVFAGGASSVSNLVPFFIPLGMISVSGAWKITTGANVSCIGIGNFA